jgi:5-methylcytosine-specific restriction endonuclease McrA
LCEALKRLTIAPDVFSARYGYCGRKPPDVKLHVDHVKALASGGKTVLENMVTACATCNVGKGVDEM